MEESKEFRRELKISLWGEGGGRLGRVDGGREGRGAVLFEEWKR